MKREEYKYTIKYIQFQVPFVILVFWRYKDVTLIFMSPNPV